jgi:REP element-mobilizing transposase RayT
VIDGEMGLNEAGRVVQHVWDGLPTHYPGVELDAFVVMPNHVHGIVVLGLGGTIHDGALRAGLKPAPTGPDGASLDDGGAAVRRRHALPEIVRAFKTFTARRINEIRGTPGVVVWQRNYYEHIVRNEESLTRGRQYIADNPARWATDRENPDSG